MLGKRRLTFAGGGLAVLIALAFLRPNRYLASDLPHSWLGVSDLRSTHYELVRVVEEPVKGLIVLEDRKQGLFILRGERVLDQDASTYCYWKLNRRGQIVDTVSLPVSVALMNSGSFFADDHYVDWVDSGDEEQHPYVEDVDADDLSKEELNERIRSARQIDLGADYQEQAAHIFLLEEEGWSVVRSKELFESLEPKVLVGEVTSSRASPELPKDAVLPTDSRFVVVEEEGDPFSDWSEPDRLIRLEHFEEGEVQSRSFYDVNNHGRSGRHGVGYFRLRHEGEVLRFKAHTFLGDDQIYQPNIAAFLLPTAPPIAVLHATGPGNGREGERPGFYVVRPILD